jgi:hypothetical protein
VGALALGATGCSPVLDACPAVGWSSTLYVSVDETAPAVATGLVLALCDGEGCEPGRGTDTGITEIRGSSERGWSASLLGGQPVVGYRLTDESGALVREGHVALDWVRVGGDERCGGPREARIVV